LNDIRDEGKDISGLLPTVPRCLCLHHGCRCRQVSITVSIVSTKRLPPALCVPKDSFRQMTACRRARLLALLVDSTSCSKKVHNHCRLSDNPPHMPINRGGPLNKPHSSTPTTPPPTP